MHIVASTKMYTKLLAYTVLQLVEQKIKESSNAEKLEKLKKYQSLCKIALEFYGQRGEVFLNEEDVAEFK